MLCEAEVVRVEWLSRSLSAGKDQARYASLRGGVAVELFRRNENSQENLTRRREAAKKKAVRGRLVRIKEERAGRPGTVKRTPAHHQPMLRQLVKNAI